MSNRIDQIEKINKLYRYSLLAIDRDIRAIIKEGRYGKKLSPNMAKDLRDYTKLLGEMKKAHQGIKSEAGSKEVETAATVDTEVLEEAVKGE